MGEGAADSLECRELFLLCLPIGMIIGGVSAKGSGPYIRPEDAATGTYRSPNAIPQGYQRNLAQQIEDSAIPAKVIEALNRYSVRTGLNAVTLPLTAGPSSAGLTPEYEADTDLVLEVAVKHVSIDSRDDRTALLSLTAKVRVVSAQDNKTLERFQVTSALRHDLKELIFNAAVARTLAIAIDDIAENAIDETLLLYRGNRITKTQIVPTSGGAVAQREQSGYTLETIFPPPENKTPIPNLQPTMEWEPVPSNFDLTVGQAEGQARNLRYDLRLYEENIPGIVYERMALDTASHQIEKPLRPCATYRWTVRAVFELNGSPRVTEWSTAKESIWARSAAFSPNLTKYAAFRTPPCAT